MKKTLWRVLGPLAVAVVLVLGVLLLPFTLGTPSQATLTKAASSLSDNVLKGQRVKNAAMADNYVPFIGSSELSRMDSFHPSVLAQKYHRNYTPFLMGTAGTQSLTHFFSMNALQHMTGKKAVVVVSPQWFVKKGVRKSMFDYFYSPSQVAYFLDHAKNNTADRYAAARLLDFPSSESDGTVEDALKNVALGKPMTDFQKTYVQKIKTTLLDHQDALFSQLFMQSNEGTLDKAAAVLPKTYDVKNLDALATQIGAKETNGNSFEIKNSFYNERVKRIEKNLKNSQVNFNYVESPEFSDFQLLLNTFAKKKMEVLFVIPPINQRWAEYTGLDLNMIEAFTRKVEYQLRSQGFNHVLDLTQDGGEQYFMEDTIHIGWRGWLKMDQSVQPFLKDLNAGPVDYKMNNHFYTKSWQNAKAPAVE
ncbi:D-alanyl-lipoteichoic acid biosynthesis protein DltD [Lacticaseibacillus brantae]|uniref:Protein DltD n=1 Tax=Lacticaseibacillus brantae DSM 23927 TaxID=1423727 RepID=A0A0R2B7C7_9LACO|nr:D-alanyl-lipoteichoic acid biosynthesis protein DltD [Lacticaseibacillus brantae]KRM71555.1 D-alanyl transfer protein [Lacticaseibacillus brantae DSM 23927]